MRTVILAEPQVMRIFKKVRNPTDIGNTYNQAIRKSLVSPSGPRDRAADHFYNSFILALNENGKKYSFLLV